MDLIRSFFASTLEIQPSNDGLRARDRHGINHAMLKEIINLG